MFSILIPSFNNLEYLKTCIDSLKKNSKYTHQIIIHINEGTDGSLDYVKKNNVEYTYSKNNIGMPKALNKSSKLAKFNYILISHDDFYFCPDWDIEFVEELSLYNHNNFHLSGFVVLIFIVSAGLVIFIFSYAIFSGQIGYVGFTKFRANNSFFFHFFVIIFYINRTRRFTNGRRFIRFRFYDSR